MESKMHISQDKLDMYVEAFSDLCSEIQREHNADVTRITHRMKNKETGTPVLEVQLRTWIPLDHKKDQPY